MATKLTPKELSKRPERLAPGHRLCAGCGASIIVRQMMAAIDDPVVVSCATGCLEVATTIYPYTAWRVPFIHNAFENSASTMAGVEAAYATLHRVWKSQNAEDCLETRLWPVPHEFNAEMQQAAFDWLDTLMK